MNREIQAAFFPISAIPTPATAATVSTTPIVLFTDLPATGAGQPRGVVRRIRVANTHATQTLAIHLVAHGTAAGGAQSVTSSGAIIIFPRTAESFLVSAGLTILAVGEGASTTFQAVASDI